MQSPQPKVDREGRFIEFSGVTIIAHMKNVVLCENVYKSISRCELTKKYYSLLPPESYHMTILNLFSGDNLEKFLNESLPFKYSTVNMLTPRVVSTKLTASKEVVKLEFILLEENKQSIHEISTNLNELNSFDESSEFYISSKKIPSKFHMTLGYKYQDSSDGLLAQIKDELEKNVDPIIAEQAAEISFKEAELSYFRDMTKFFPWDGEENFLKAPKSRNLVLGFAR